MGSIEKIRQDLINKFPFLQDRVKSPRLRRLSADVEARNFRPVFDYAVKDLGFIMLCTITGTDEGEKIGFIYHIAKEDGTILGLKTYAPKTNPVIKTITDSFPPADIYERELMDLLGAKIEGLAPGRRYPLSDDWPADEYPLRKDWKPKKKETTTNA